MIQSVEPGNNGSRWKEPAEWLEPEPEPEPERNWSQSIIEAAISFLSAIGWIWMFSLAVAGLCYLVLLIWGFFRGFTR